MTGAKCNLRVLSGKDSFCYETHNDPFCIDKLTVAERLDVPVARSGLASDPIPLVTLGVDLALIC